MCAEEELPKVEDACVDPEPESAEPESAGDEEDEAKGDDTPVV